MSCRHPVSTQVEPPAPAQIHTTTGRARGLPADRRRSSACQDGAVGSDAVEPRYRGGPGHWASVHRKRSMPYPTIALITIQPGARERRSSDVMSGVRRRRAVAPSAPTTRRSRPGHGRVPPAGCRPSRRRPERGRQRPERGVRFASAAAACGEDGRTAVRGSVRRLPMGCGCEVSVEGAQWNAWSPPAVPCWSLCR